VLVFTKTNTVVLHTDADLLLPPGPVHQEARGGEVERVQVLHVGIKVFLETFSPNIQVFLLLMVFVVWLMVQMHFLPWRFHALNAFDSITSGTEETLALDRVKQLLLTTQYFETLRHVAQRNDRSDVFLHQGAACIGEARYQLQRLVATAVPQQAQM